MGREIVGDVSDEGMVMALEENLCACCRSLGGLEGAGVWEDEELCYVVTGRPGTFFNCVARARLVGERAETRMEEVVRRFRERGAEGRWWTSPLSLPPDLGSRLEAHGFARRVEAPGMGLDLAATGMGPEPP